MAIKHRYWLLWALLLTSIVHGGGTSNGRTYSNFGPDLDAPIFPVNGVLNIYRNKTDARPLVTLRDKPVVDQRGEASPCVKTAADGWARCTVGNVAGWIKHSEFRTSGEYLPVASWPFRYWLYIASPGTGSEDAVMLRDLVPKIPYLVAPTEYSNIFFHVLFDPQGRAFSPKTLRPTGDRAFLIGDAVYLAPEDPRKRSRATWLFLNYYNEKMNALCPARNPHSCLNAVNLAADWPGIKSMYEEPAEQFRQKANDEAWFGAGEVAFARHTDAIVPLMYRVPNDVAMEVDPNPRTESERDKNREKLFCIADCSKR